MSKYIELEDDRVPALGLGTHNLVGASCSDGVRHALELGYRHIDTAQAYENEEMVGRAIDEAPVDRGDIFLTSKIWFDKQRHDDLIAATHASLRRLGTDYLDLLLLHWPNRAIPIEESLAAMMELQKDGKLRHIGVSNFTPTLLDAALDSAPVVCNQVEYHPYLSQGPLLERAREHDLMFTSYSPLAQGKVLNDSVLQEIGDGHGKNPAQVTLRWHMQQERVAAIPRSSVAAHRRSNLEIFDFELSGEEMDRIFDLARGDRLVDPKFAPDWER